MKKLITSVALCFGLFISSTFATNAYAIDPKFKMIGTMAGYGAVGGVLLGAASLAFDTGGRAIAKGASLGLYAGILFGGYLLVNYELGKRGYGPEGDNYYPNSSSPYEDDQANLLNSYSELMVAKVEQKKDPKVDPSFSLNFLSINF